jgi:hypothetical protein
MQKSSINPNILQEMLTSGTNAASKGQAQFFTPVKWARTLCLPLAEWRLDAVDLTAGNCQLLSGVQADHAYGCDIDPIVSLPSACHTVTADLTLFQSLLHEAKFKADLFVLNPPWDIYWHRDRLKWLAHSPCTAVADAFAAHDGRTGRDTIDSTVATMMLALAFMSDLGEAMLIANEATLQRLIFAGGAPHRQLQNHIWAHVIIDGNICSTKSDPASDFKTGVIYFCRAPQSGRIATYSTKPGLDPFVDTQEICRHLAASRDQFRYGPESAEYNHTLSTARHWHAAAEEWRKRTDIAADQRPDWNIWMAGGFIRTNLSLFEQCTERVDVAECKRLLDLNGRQPMSLVIQRNDRKALEAATTGGLWRVSPEVNQAVAMAIMEYDANRAPLKSLNAIQRLGYLDELDEIECKKDLRPHFSAGRKYPIRTLTVQVCRNGQKMNNEGFKDAVEWTGSELCIYIKSPLEGDQCFMEERLRSEAVNISLPDLSDEPNPTGPNAVRIDYTLQQIADHFIIPEVLDVAALHPDGYNRNLDLLRQIEEIVNS